MYALFPTCELPCLASAGAGTFCFACADSKQVFNVEGKTANKPFLLKPTFVVGSRVYGSSWPNDFGNPSAFGLQI